MYYTKRGRVRTYHLTVFDISDMRLWEIYYDFPKCQLVRNYMRCRNNKNSKLVSLSYMGPYDKLLDYLIRDDQVRIKSHVM